MMRPVRGPSPLDFLSAGGLRFRESQFGQNLVHPSVRILMGASRRSSGGAAQGRLHVTNATELIHFQLPEITKTAAILRTRAWHQVAQNLGLRKIFSERAAIRAPVALNTVVKAFPRTNPVVY
jgi:hypothetical protein